MRKILSVLDILGDEDEVTANMAKAIVFKSAIDKATKKSESPKPKSQNPLGMTDGVLIAALLAVGASPIIGGVWLYKKLKK